MKSVIVLAAILLSTGALAQSPPTNVFGVDFTNNNTLAVSASGHLRLRYNSTTAALEQSINGAAYVGVSGGSLPAVGPGPGTFTWATADTLSLDINGRVTAISNVTRTLTAGAGLLGGGTLALDLAFAIDYTQSPTWTGIHTFANYQDNTIIAAPASPATGNVRLFAVSRAAGLDAMAYQTVAGNQIVIGRDLLIGARNVSGATLTKGTVVYVNGSSSGLPRIEKAQADSGMTKVPALGILTQDIPNNSNGFILTRGVVSNINTSGMSAGDTIYVDPTTAGAFTNVEPAHPQVVQALGTVEVVNITAGSIMVDLAPLNLNALDGVNGTSFAIGNGAGATARSLLFKNSNTGALQWTPTAARTLTLPDTTGVISASATALTSGRVPVATTGGLLQDSTFTASANTLDIAAAGQLTIGNGTATGMLLGGNNLTTGATIGVGSGQTVTFQNGGVVNLTLASTVLQWARGSARSIGFAAQLFDTAGDNFTVNAGQGGTASATGAGVGGVLTVVGGNGGNGTSALTAGIGGQGTFGGGTGGAGATTGPGPNSGGLAVFRGGTGGLVLSGNGGGNGGNAAIRGGLATGTGVNGNVLIGDLNTLAIVLGQNTTVNARVTVQSPSAATTSAQLVLRDSAGNAHFGVDAFGLPSLGSRFEFRENWLWTASAAGASTTLTASATNAVINNNTTWAYTSTANATGFTNISGFATGTAVNAGITIGSGTVAGSNNTLLRTPTPFVIFNATNTAIVAEWQMATNAVGANGVTIAAGVTNGGVNAVPHPGGYWFEKGNGDTNWKCMTDSGSVGPTANTPLQGIPPVAGTAQMFRIEVYGAGTPLGAATAKFYVDSVLMCNTTTNVFTGGALAFSAYNAITVGSTQRNLSLGPVLLMFNQVPAALVPN